MARAPALTCSAGRYDCPYSKCGLLNMDIIQRMCPIVLQNCTTMSKVHNHMSYDAKACSVCRFEK